MKLEWNDAFSNSYFAGVKARTGTTDIVRNPFKTKYKNIGKGVHAYLIEPLWPPVYWWSVIPFAAGIFFGKAWIIIIGSIMGSIGFFWSAPFYHLLLRIGLRRAGYKGRIKHISSGAALRVVLCGAA